MKCKTQDSNGHVCNKTMTKEEQIQDGMCDICACHVFQEIIIYSKYKWYHNKPGDSNNAN